jgi:hypothetical protein
MSVQMTISINGQLDRTFDNIPWQSGMNVQQAMEKAFGLETGYDFALQYFGADLGYEAIMIDNISQQAGTDAFLFWELSVNGNISSTGIDETMLSDGDEVEWNYTTYSSDTHNSTRYKQLRQIARTK